MNENRVPIHSIVENGSPNFSELLNCSYCQINTRQREMLWFLLKDSADKGRDARIYAQEQITPFYKLLVKYFPDAVGSEFLGDNINDIPSGQIINGIRHEDCLHLSFPDQSLDYIVSNAVFEHVPDIHKAFSEAYRVLSPTGKLLFVIPFFLGQEKTIKRTGLENGELVYYEPPVYHGSFVSAEGALVFYDFGHDIYEFLNDAGFSSVKIICADDYRYGFYGRLMLFVAQK